MNTITSVIESGLIQKFACRPETGNMTVLTPRPPLRRIKDVLLRKEALRQIRDLQCPFAGYLLTSTITLL